MNCIKSESPNTTLPPAGSAATLDHPSPIQSAGNRHHEPGQWPGRRDVEERVPVARGRAHPDDGAQRAEEEGRGRRDEVRQADRGAVGARREVVAELVGAEDGEQREGEGHAVENAPGLGERIEGEERPRSGDDRRDHGEHEEDDIDPRLRRHLHVHEGQRPHPGQPRRARLEKWRIAEGPEARDELGQRRGRRKQQPPSEAEGMPLGAHLLHRQHPAELRARAPRSRNRSSRRAPRRERRRKGQRRMNSPYHEAREATARRAASSPPSR